MQQMSAQAHLIEAAKHTNMALASLAASLPGEVEPGEVEPETETPKVVEDDQPKPVKKAKKKVEAKPEPEPVAEKDEKPFREVVRGVCVKLAEAHGRDAVKEALQHVSGETIFKKVPDDKLADLKAHVEERL